MKRIWSQCAKELVQFRRDRITVALAFLLPLMTLLIFGFAIRLEIPKIALAIQDQSLTPLSRAYVERLYANQQFQPVRWSESDPIQSVIDSGQAKVAIVIPPDFANKLEAGKSTPVQVWVDATDVNTARVIRSSVAATTRFFMADQGLLKDRIQRVTARIRLWFNPGREESLYIVPGVFALVLAVYPPLLTSIAMVREKERGTIVQVYASSMTALELLAGKALAYLVVGMAEAAVVISVGVVLFGLRLAGDPLPLLLGTPLMVLTMVGFGLLIGTRASNQNAAVQGVATIGFITALLLSGFIYPLSNIPFPLSILSWFIPARYYIDLTRDAFVRGTGWAGIWYVFPVLFGLGFNFYRVAWLNLRKMQVPD